MRLRPTLKLEIIVFVLDANNVGLTLVQSHLELVDPQFKLVNFTPNSSHAILHLYQITTLVDDIRNTIYVIVLYLIQLAIETPKTTGALFTLLRCELNERAILWPSGRIHVAVASLPSTGYVVQTMTKTGPVRRRSRFFISTRVAANHLLQFKMRHLLY